MSEATSFATQSRPVPIAPAPDGRTEPQESTESLMPYTCVTCAKRKVKCDKSAPSCSTCRKARLDCEYQEPAPRKRKRRPVDDVHERLEQYEKILKQNGLLPQSESATTSPGENAANPFWMGKTRPANESGPGKLLSGHGRTRFIDSNVWRNLGNDDMAPSSDEEDDAPAFPINGNQSTTDPLSAALLGPQSTASSLISLHPTYESAMKLWKIYVENVDPIVKVVHVPSAVVVLQRAAANPSSASKATEALLFAIYHFAIISINETECQEAFGEPRAKLASRYHDALRQALVNANLIRTKDLVVFQAYELFLLAVRSKSEPHTFWILTGVAVRIAQRIGLHRDGEEYGLKPFDVELRRRVFWQLLPLDGLAGQMCGTGICITPESWDVKQPLNINDSDMWPEMTDPPEPRVGATDMMFCLARTELAVFTLKSSSGPGNWPTTSDLSNPNEIERGLKALEDLFETKYLRYCDFANPLHQLVMAMARTSVNSGRLRVRLPHMKSNKDVPEQERRELWSIADKILDYDLAANGNPGLAKFRWHLQDFFQWNALIWVLQSIQRYPLAVDFGVWLKIDGIYANHPNMLEPKRSFPMAMGQIVVKTWDTYASAQLREKQIARPEPSFVATLRTHSNKRAGSQAGSSAPSGSEYNPFNPSRDGNEDLFYDFGNSAENAEYFDFAFLPEINAGSGAYWVFMDQQGHDPSTFQSLPAS